MQCGSAAGIDTAVCPLGCSRFDASEGSLRQAVDAVCAAGTIDFDLSYPATIGLQRPLRIRQSVTVDGPGHELLAIDNLLLINQDDEEG